MIQPLDLVYRACKYGRLNRSLSLVCMSPDTSKAERNEEEEMAGVGVRGEEREKKVERAVNGNRLPHTEMKTMGIHGNGRTDSLLQCGQGALLPKFRRYGQA